jgi:hypothetical protein
MEEIWCDGRNIRDNAVLQMSTAKTGRDYVYLSSSPNTSQAISEPALSRRSLEGMSRHRKA